MSVTSKICGVIRAVTRKRRPFTSAVILAAGSGTRMNSGISKQLMTLCGRPMFLYSVDAFSSCPYIDEIIIVCKKEEMAFVSELIRKYKPAKVKDIVCGRDTRQLSALAGFEKISDESRFVAIHDAARPLITTDIIADVVSAAYAHGAASAVSEVTDTIKRTDRHGDIVSTEDRDKLLCAQTPQVFSTVLYRAASYTAMKENVPVTDDNSLVERLGQSVRSVKVTSCNLKVTRAEDLAMAEAVLRSRKTMIYGREKDD